MDARALDNLCPHGRKQHEDMDGVFAQIIASPGAVGLDDLRRHFEIAAREYYHHLHGVYQYVMSSGRYLTRGRMLKPPCDQCQRAQSDYVARAYPGIGMRGTDQLPAMSGR